MHVQRHGSPLRKLSSIGSDPSEWIGPGLHTHHPTPDVEKVTAKQPTDYLGPTSYSAIFLENELGDRTEDFGQGAADTTGQEADHDKPPYPEQCNLEAEEHVSQGVRILKRFPERPLCDQLLNRYFDECDVLIPEQVVCHVHESIWSTYGECLSAVTGTNHERLSEMSTQLCKTAMAPLKPSTTSNEWLESFMGRHLRWEIIGNLFAIFGLAIMTYSDWDPLFASANESTPYTKRQYGSAMRECAEACLALCNDVDAVNDFVVSLMTTAYCLQSFYEGDASKCAYRQW